MHCASCAQTIEKSLKKQDGVEDASVNFASEKAYVKYNPNLVDVHQLAEVVRGAGYDVKSDLQKTFLKIGGMSCASCAQKIEKNLSKTRGVSEASVNFASQTAMVHFDSTQVEVEELETVTKDSGYEIVKSSGEKTVEFKAIGMG